MSSISLIASAVGEAGSEPPPTPAATERVAIVGSGNWGSAVARIIGENVHHFDKFDKRVPMWVFEEVVTHGGAQRKLTEVINATRENVKYLPGFKLPDNVVAEPDLAAAVAGATLLVFVLPHQFLPRLLPVIAGALGGEAALAGGRVRAISLIKGIDVSPAGGLALVSDTIRRGLPGVSCDVLMGANVAGEIAEGHFSEATVGYTGGSPATAELWRDLLETRAFRIQLSPDASTVELFGALKNVVALACGFSDGLRYGYNTKAALIRQGAQEMLRFARRFYAPDASTDTMLESCGLADLITTCFGGRNRRCAEAFVTTGRDWAQLEVELIGGQKLQGTLACDEVAKMVAAAGAQAEFPLFTVTVPVGGHGAGAREGGCVRHARRQSLLRGPRCEWGVRECGLTPRPSPRCLYPLLPRAQHRIQHRLAPPTALVEMHVAGQHPRVEHAHPEHHADHTPESAPLFVPKLPAAVAAAAVASSSPVAPAPVVT